DAHHQIPFPRQHRGRYLSIPDFHASKERCKAEGAVDALPPQHVTMGTPIADFANELFAADNSRDYLEVHGLSVQLTEALAEAWHRRVRDELRLPEGAGSDEVPDAIHDYFEL